jgi:hypothetical protein
VSITIEMVSVAVAMVAALATVTTIFINRFARLDDRIGKVEQSLADHKVKAAENYVTTTALSTFEERLVRTEERMLGEIRAVRAEVAAAMANRSGRRRVVAAEGEAE